MAKKILIGFGIGVLVLLVGLGLAVEAGLLPDTKVLKDKEITPGLTRSISDKVTLLPGERVRYYYCADFLSHDADGNVITNKRVISYERNQEGGLEWCAATWPEIRAVTVKEKGGWASDTLVEIATVDGGSFYLFLACEGDRDQEAIDYIKNSLPR